MTSRLDCAELGYVCDWAITADNTPDVLAAATTHLRTEHGVDSPSDALNAYLEGFTTTVDESADDAPGEVVAKHSGVLSKRPPGSHAMARAYGIPMAGRVSMVLVAIGTVAMVGLLYRTQANAAGISEETASIAESGRGVNEYTDSIMQLDTTNKLATSLYGSIQPLQGGLAGIADVTVPIRDDLQSINSSSSSIDGSARQIDGSVQTIQTSVNTIAGQVKVINTSLVGINGNAAGILTTAEAIRSGINLISSNLATTSGVADQILADARGINGGLQGTNHYSACIDNGLNGGASC